MKRLILFVFAFIFWILLVWPFDPETGAVRFQDVAAGAAAALLAAAVMREITVRGFGRWLQPARYFWALVYLFVFVYYVVKANLDMAYRVLHPKMPIRPGIVKVRSSLRTPSGLTALANSITLTPGTLTVEALPDGVFYVHWINVRSTDGDEAARQILGRFEWFIKKIFEQP